MYISLLLSNVKNQLSAQLSPVQADISSTLDCVLSVGSDVSLEYNMIHCTVLFWRGEGFDVIEPCLIR